MSNYVSRIFLLALLILLSFALIYYLDKFGIYTFKELKDPDILFELIEQKKNNVNRSKFELNSRKRIGLGVATLQEDVDLKSIYDFENLVERKMEYVLIFRSWDGQDKEFPKEYFQNLANEDYKIILTWEPWKRDFVNPTQIQDEYKLETISAGKHDEFIREWAQELKELNTEVILRFAHEPTTERGEQQWYPWQGDPDNYIFAFQHIVSIFREEGADNVKFMWSPLNHHDWELVWYYYPGDSYVDYIGLTLINFGKDDWLGCSFLLDSQLEVLAWNKKPIIIVEIASFEEGGDKALWYKDCINRISRSSQIIGLISIQTDLPEKTPQGTLETRIDSSQDSLESFKDSLSKGNFK